MPQQLPLPFELRPALGRADYVVADGNLAALAWIDRWPWPGGGLVVHGAAGCGKTHLAHVLQAARGGRILAARSLDDEVLGADASSIEIEPGRPLIVEDVDGAGAGSNERALLHLYNRVVEHAGCLMLTARKPPAQWGLALADLRSRMLALPSVEIAPPDDALLAAVLVKHFADRQVRVGRDVVDYLAVRIERSFAAAHDVAEAIDRIALIEGRPITVNVAREALARRDS